MRLNIHTEVAVRQSSTTVLYARANAKPFNIIRAILEACNPNRRLQ
jgi:hypothetical protein